MQSKTFETLIGAIVIFIAAGFIYFAYTTTSQGSLETYRTDRAIFARGRAYQRHRSQGFGHQGGNGVGAHARSQDVSGHRAHVDRATM